MKSLEGKRLRKQPRVRHRPQESLACQGPSAPSARVSRRGFTLVELLVTIAIIAVLLSLLVPAVQAARMSASSGQCMNHLRQIGIAVFQYADVNGGVMPFHVGDGDMTEKKQSAMFALLPFCEENEEIFHCPNDLGSFEDATPFHETYGSSYKLEGRALSELDLPERTVLEYDPSKGTWKNKAKKAKPLVVRRLKHHVTGIDIKKAIEKKTLTDEDRVQSGRIQLARDFVEPWKVGEVKWTELRGVHTLRGYHAPTHMNVVFVDGHVESFSDKVSWNAARGKSPDSGD